MCAHVAVSQELLLHRHAGAREVPKRVRPRGPVAQVHREMPWQESVHL